jgi:hypothetical protein
MIVDDAHLMIAFTTLRAEAHLQTAIFFENRPIIAQEFVNGLSEWLFAN